MTIFKKKCTCYLFKYTILVLNFNTKRINIIYFVMYRCISKDIDRVF